MQSAARSIPDTGWKTWQPIRAEKKAISRSTSISSHLRPAS